MGSGRLQGKRREEPAETSGRRADGCDGDMLRLPYGTIWPMDDGSAVAYTQDAARAAAIGRMSLRELPYKAMGVYRDARDRIIGWQVRFDVSRMAEARAILSRKEPA